MSELGDIADRAAAREAEFLQDAIARQHRAAALQGPSATECDICGAVIPPARRTAVPGVRLCIHCQSAQEQRRRTHAF